MQVLRAKVVLPCWLLFGKFSCIKHQHFIFYQCQFFSTVKNQRCKGRTGIRKVVPIAIITSTALFLQLFAYIFSLYPSITGRRSHYKTCSTRRFQVIVEILNPQIISVVIFGGGLLFRQNETWIFFYHIFGFVYLIHIKRRVSHYKIGTSSY